MSDEDEMEDFEVNDEDLRRAMDPSYRSRKNKMSREDAMLGVFASRHDSDEEDYGNNDAEILKSFSFSDSRRSGGKKSGINFVSKSSTSQKEQPARAKKEPMIVDTYVSTDEENESDENAAEMDSKNDESREEDSKAIPSVEKLKPKQNLMGPTFAPKREPAKVKKTVKLDKSEIKEVGNWEKYEKGFGSKMLMKMGWQKGMGLGREGQGRAVPVEATLRKGKGAVGKYGAESREVRTRVDSDSDDEAKKSKHISQWNKKGKTQDLHYGEIRTAEELLSMASNNQKKLKRAEEMIDNRNHQKDTGGQSSLSSVASMSKMKIIDMTGREQKVHHGYGALSQIGIGGKVLSEGSKKAQFDLPELVRNLDILVNMTEDKIIHSEKKIKHFDDMVVNLNYEERRNRERLDQQQAQIDKLEGILEVVEHCERLLETTSDMRQLMNMFIGLKRDYADEFLIFNLYELAIPLFSPLLKQKMSQWRPFASDKNTETSDPLYCLDIYSDLKDLFRAESYQSAVNPFHRLIWETWMVSFRKLLLQESIRACADTCVDILNAWSRVLPKYVYENVLEQLVLVKLRYEVEVWNPLVDPVPIHKWIHPWLPLMKDRLDSEVLPSIRFKLASALTNWHPSDMSAKAILLPWRPPAFTAVAWDSFMSRHIAPKLELVLSDELAINPNVQNLEPWKWVMAWLDLVPMASLITILERSFFPKWHSVLATWLNSSPNYEEVSKWYIGWKSQFPERLHTHASVKAKLSQALIMMNRSLSGGANIDNTAYTKQVPRQPAPPQQQQPSSLADAGVQILSSANAKITSFKDMVERKAAEHNLLFLPVPNRFSQEGQQVYRFGNVNVYIEKNVIFLLQSGNWIPTALGDLVAKAY